MTGDEKRAVVGLWGVLGVGAVSLERIRHVYPDLGELADQLPIHWISSVPLDLPAREGLLSLQTTLGQHADRILERAFDGGMSFSFKDEPAYPRGLAAVHDAPPFLFYRGRGDRPNAPRRLAVVGSRSFESNFEPAAAAMCRALSTRLIIVSGGARGIDQISHYATIQMKGETWAFMGSALDELDPSQATLAPRIVDSGGTVFSELPPGVRADKQTFPKRNRLISGASDAVLVMRAKPDSGALITVESALEQRRMIFAVPGQIDHGTAVGCNGLIRHRIARLAATAGDVFEDMGLDATKTPETLPLAEPVDLTQLSSNAQHAFGLLDRSAVDFDSLLGRAQPLSSGLLASALIELELAGLLVQKPGRRYERR